MSAFWWFQPTPNVVAAAGGPPAGVNAALAGTEQDDTTTSASAVQASASLAVSEGADGLAANASISAAAGVGGSLAASEGDDIVTSTATVTGVGLPITQRAGAPRAVEIDYEQAREDDKVLLRVIAKFLEEEGV